MDTLCRKVILNAVTLVTAALSLPIASAEEAPSYQLEAGTNVRVIDIGSEGTDALANAVKALNEKKSTEAPATTDNATPMKDASPPSPDSPDATKSDNANPVDGGEKMHPAWLSGTWVINGDCQGASIHAANTITITQDTATFAKVSCQLTTLSTPHENQVVGLYECSEKAALRQRVHRFERTEDGSLLLDGFDRAVSCEGGKRLSTP